tara:strand:+ start:193 stop:699 length:507 start_codon:yes stop_codon:yes gene_type:complete
MNKDFKNYLIISLSFFIFLVIDSFSFSHEVNEIKPSLVLLGLIYWNLALPQKVGVGFSLLLGLLYDFLQGTLLGMYPLIFILTSYVCQRFFNRIRPMRFIQQSTLIFLFILIVKFYLAVDFNNSLSRYLSLIDGYYLLLTFCNALASAVIWPVLFYSLRYYRRRWIKT